MKNNSIREMADPAIAEKLEELRRERLTLAIQSRTGQLEKTARVREVRRDIARLLTETTRRALQTKAN
jgi:large subunit ribosomal protein L29